MGRCRVDFHIASKMSENIGFFFFFKRKMTVTYRHLNVLDVLVLPSGENISYVAQAGLKLMILLASRVLGLQVCAAVPS